MRRTAIILAAAVALAASLGGCASSKSSVEFAVAPGRYDAAFDAAKEALRDYRFLPERVDAEQGVISTRSKATSGLATPWDLEQSTLGQEVEDFVQEQSRVARITFTPEDASLPLGEGAATGRVEVVVSRTYLRGWRPSTKAILFSGFSRDPVSEARGQPEQFTMPISRDERLAARLAAKIRARLQRGSE